MNTINAVTTLSTETVKPTIKAVFFDIDGTLVSFKTRTVPESTRLAIKHLRDKNIKVIIATGRSINMIDHIKELEFDGFVCFNGGCCIKPDGTVLHRQSINPDDIKALLAYSNDHPICFSLMYEDSVKINQTNPEAETLFSHLNLPIPPQMDSNDTAIDSVLQANVFLAPADEKQFMEAVMPNSIATRWTSSFVDVNCGGLSKEIGVQVFCDHFGIDISETMSFGDGGNDINMLKGTAIGVAMGNANENVKEIADYVTTEVDENGIWNALVHYQLIQENEWTCNELV